MPRSRASAGRPLLVVCAVFGASRFVAWLAGVQFDSSPLRAFWQYLDPELLRHQLLTSVWHLHAQPPLYNIWLGLTLKAGGASAPTLMHLEYVALGLLLAVLTYVLFDRVLERPWTAALIASAITVSPAVLLYENWLFYEYPVLALLVGALVALSVFARGGSHAYAHVAFALFAALVLTRATFQLPWLLLIVLATWWAMPGARRTILIAAALPVAVVVALYVKNTVMFDMPTTSSWAGMNLAQIAYAKLPPGRLDALVRAGTLSPISRIEPFSGIEAYPDIVRSTRRTGVAALDQQHKTALPGEAEPPVNYNNLAYIEISKRYQHDAIRFVLHDPGVYGQGIAAGLHKYFVPSSDYFFVDRNRQKIGWWNTLWDRVVYWRWPSVSSLSPALVLAYAIAFVYGFFLFRRGRRDPVLLAAWATVVWVTVVTAFGEVVENQRLRFCLDPLVLLLDAAALFAVAAQIWRSPLAGASR